MRHFSILLRSYYKPHARRFVDKTNCLNVCIVGHHEDLKICLQSRHCIVTLLVPDCCLVKLA